MLTYWLKSENESVRSARLQKCGKKFKYNTTDDVITFDKDYCNMLGRSRTSEPQHGLKENGEKPNDSDSNLVRLFRDTKGRSLSKDAAASFIPAQLARAESFSSRSLPPNKNNVSDSDNKRVFQYPNGLYTNELHMTAGRFPRDANTTSDSYDDDPSTESEHLLTRHMSIGGRSPSHVGDIDPKSSMGTKAMSNKLSIRPKSRSGEFT